MEDIKKHCDDNLGGMNTFKFIPTKDVISIQKPINSRVLEPVQLKDGKEWFECYATPGTISLDEDQQQNDQGDYFKVKLNASIPKDRTTVADVLNQMANETFIIDCIDNNGHRKLVGTLSEPLRFNSNYKSGQNASNKNNNVIEFYGDILVKSPTYYI